jgi:holo-[acyl-carrier protein] synthase
MNAPVLGIGVDLVENARMKTSLERWGQAFKDRVFLPEEQSYCETKAFPHHHYAARFAVKESVSKAFGTGIGPRLNWLDMEVRRNGSTGAPSVRLRGKALALAAEHRAGAILTSLSHTDHYAVATALILGRDAPGACAS